MSRLRLREGRFLEFALLACVVLVALLVVLFVVSVVGCTPAPETAADVAAGAYAEELQVCVHKAKSRAESRACRAEVECRWGHGQCTDGGTP